PTTDAGGPAGVSSLLPLRCPCMLPPSPREPRRVRIPDSSPADISLRPTTGGSATPLPALAAISAGSTLTGLIGRSRLLRPAGLSPSLGCVRPHLTVEPSRTLCRSCFDAISCPITPGPRLLGQVEEFPRRAPCIPLAQKCWPRTIIGVPDEHAEGPAPPLPHPVQYVEIDVREQRGNDPALRRAPHRLLSSPLLQRSEEHTSELQSRGHLVCRLLLEKKKLYITTFRRWLIHTITYL